MSMLRTAFVVVSLLLCREAARLFPAFPKVREPKSDAGFIEKRAICAERGGDQIDGCPYFAGEGYCDPSSVYYQYVTSNCEASCGFCQMAPTSPPAVDQDACLNAHNLNRTHHGSSLLVWNETLAEHAEAWAEHLVNLGSLDHAEGTGEGENLYQGSKYRGVHSCLDAVEFWYREVSRYDFDNPPTTKEQFYASGTGHFTQVVWKGTTSVGAALATSSGINGVKTYIVARYYPQGNIIGKFAENVEERT